MSELIPRDFIDLLIAKIDIIDLINTHIPLKKKSSNNYFACCPFHSEKSASFSVSQQKQFYYCFGCGAHGNAIDFVMKYERLNFPETVEALARQCGLEVPRTQSAYKTNTNNALDTLMTSAARFYYEKMRHSPLAIDYLKKRGITGNIAQTFQLGYAPSGWRNLVEQLGQSSEELQHLITVGLIIKKEDGQYYDRFRERIIFPIHNYRGKIVGFGGRILEQGEPKYLNSPETPLFQKGHELYGLYQALNTKKTLERVLIVEGYMDVIALFQHDITYAVATLGTATTEHHINRLARYTSELVFCFDGDEAGRRAAWRAVTILMPILQENLQLRFLFLPDGEDPDSLVRKEGRISFEERIKQAVSLSVFFFQTLAQQNDVRTIEGRASFIKQALDMIKKIPSSLLETVFLDELALRARVDISELKTASPAKPPSQPGNEPVGTKLAPPLRKALMLLVQHPNLVASIEQPLPTYHLQGYKFFAELVEILQELPHITTGSLLERFRERREMGFLAKLASESHMIPEDGLKQELNGALKQLAVMDFAHEINSLLAKGAAQGLNDEEKQQLTTWISAKKALSEQVT